MGQGAAGASRPARQAGKGREEQGGLNGVGAERRGLYIRQQGQKEEMKEMQDDFFDLY